MREILKAGVCLNDEGMLHADQHLLLRLDIGLEVVFDDYLFVDFLQSVETARLLPSHQEHLCEGARAQLPEDIEVVHAFLPLEVSHEDGFLDQANVLLCLSAALQDALIVEIGANPFPSLAYLRLHFAILKTLEGLLTDYGI